MAGTQIPDLLLRELRAWRVQPAGVLAERLGVSRPTLARAVRGLGDQIVSRGQARRTAYAARRQVRGSIRPFPLYRIDEAGVSHQVAVLYPLYGGGFAMEFQEPSPWPLQDRMVDGWFDALPYFLDDMRPQGFLGRHFARNHSDLLQVSSDPAVWSEDDVVHALSLLASDAPGNYVLGEQAMRLALAPSSAQPVINANRDAAFEALARSSMTAGQQGSSAGGEFPKFTVAREVQGRAFHSIVKFSGADGSPSSQRWADLLVCEHLALSVLDQELGVCAAASEVHVANGRTFLEVERFDRSGGAGRLPVCSWMALNAALVGDVGRPWPEAAQGLLAEGLMADEGMWRLQRMWQFGRLIGNTDMHDGNLTFRPGLDLAPAYDMLPMLYAPARGVEVLEREFSPARPLPGERDVWLEAAGAAVHFWNTAAKDHRISNGFRGICAQNAERLESVLEVEAPRADLPRQRR
jgi:hypothetical protein